MFTPNNRIIIVDNVENELETLGKSFFTSGLGCRTFLYDQSYSDPLSNVRLAFFDINLTSKNVDHDYDNKADIIKHNSAIFNDLAAAINLYIAKDNGPFALIFWTANKDVVDAFIEYIQDTARGFSDTASPCYIGYIDKTEFLTGSPDFEKLSGNIITLLENDVVRFLFDFQERVNVASSKTISKIYQIIPKDTKWGENAVFLDNLDKILSKIGASTLGFDHAKENPDKAIVEGLIPMLNHEITNVKSTVDWKNILKTLFAAKKHGEIKSPDDLVQRKVNAVFHIEKTDDKRDVRGAVIEIDTEKKYLEVLNIDDLEKWFDLIIPFKSNKAAEKKAVFEKSVPIAIEISAACDYSNRNHRMNKYILGFKTPLINVSDDLDKQRKESSYHVGGANFHYNEEDFQIWLNLNFVLGTVMFDSRLHKPIFILKKEIMDMIGNKYASHVSRIGITSF